MSHKTALLPTPVGAHGSAVAVHAVGPGVAECERWWPLTMADKTIRRDTMSKERARLRMIGVAVLLSGIIGAGLVYWIQTQSEDPRLAEYSEAKARAESRQMGILYGKSGVMIDDLLAELKRPGTQAAIIAVISTLVALGCFYLGQQPNDQAGNDPNSHS